MQVIIVRLSKKKNNYLVQALHLDRINFRNTDISSSARTKIRIHDVYFVCDAHSGIIYKWDLFSVNRTKC